MLDTSSSQTQQKLAKTIKVSQQTISKQLHAIGEIQNEGKWVQHKLDQKIKMTKR